jgi:hypothetical protein
MDSTLALESQVVDQPLKAYDVKKQIEHEKDDDQTQKAQPNEIVKGVLTASKGCNGTGYPQSLPQRRNSNKCLLQEKVDLIAGMTVDISSFRNSAMGELKGLTFSVSIADPQLPDCPLVAVSDGFCRLTGFTREMVVGQNCRFLNQGCEMSQSKKMGLRLSSESGKRFCALISNRKCDGSLFTNYLDLRGLKVGRTASGEEKFLLLGIQTDVTEFVQGGEEIPEHHQRNMLKVARMICKQITPTLLQKTVSGAWADITEPYSKPQWIEGETVVETN